MVVYAVAARDIVRAKKFAKKWGIEKAYEGYQGTVPCVFVLGGEAHICVCVALLDDPEVDVVYNPVCRVSIYLC